MVGPHRELPARGTDALRSGPTRATFAATTSVADVLETVARRLIWVGVLLTTISPRIEFGSVHFNGGDLAGLAATCSWLAAWVLSRSRPMLLRAAFWPFVLVALGVASSVASTDIRATGVGVLELVLLWLLPTLTVPNIVSTPARVATFLDCVSIGSLVAGTLNLLQAARLGLGGGLPQVWGAAQYLQGYFQAFGLIVALSRTVGAINARQFRGSLSWAIACFVNATALLLTQTRGAWLAAFAAIVVLGILWRPSVLVMALGAVAVIILALSGTVWVSAMGQRLQSIFSLESNLSGFESSLGRLALAVTAWKMFLAHPLMGIGLKNFAIAMPLYAPPGMPLAYEMGPGHVLTAVEGPHSTYLSLLSEVGIFGFVSLFCWELGALWYLYRGVRAERAVVVNHEQGAAVMLAAVVVVVVYNLFFEMNQAGTLIFVSVLALGYRSVGRLAPETTL